MGGMSNATLRGLFPLGCVAAASPLGCVAAAFLGGIGTFRRSFAALVFSRSAALVSSSVAMMSFYFYYYCSNRYRDLVAAVAPSRNYAGCCHRHPSWLLMNGFHSRSSRCPLARLDPAFLVGIHSLRGAHHARSDALSRCSVLGSYHGVGVLAVAPPTSATTYQLLRTYVTDKLNFF